MADVGYRPLGLESDIGNQNFSGAKDPDSLLHVEFYWDEGLDQNLTESESIKAQKLVRVKKPRSIYVRIMVPGDKSSIIERSKEGRDEVRWPKQWRWFQMQEGLVARNENDIGWKIEDWDELSDDERRELKFKRFYTVEQIAGANDAQINMMGMGGPGLRIKAIQALKARSGAATAVKEKELQELKDQVAKLTALISAGAQPASPTPPPMAEAAPPAEKPRRTMSDEHKAKMAAGRAAAKAKKAA